MRRARIEIRHKQTIPHAIELVPSLLCDPTVMRRLAIVLALASVPLLGWLSIPPARATVSGSLVQQLPTALPPTPEVELISNATLVFRRAVELPSAAIPASVLQTARALAIFPGASYDGTTYCAAGIVSARGADPLHWTPPAVITLQAKIPVRLDVDAIDFVL